MMKKVLILLACVLLFVSATSFVAADEVEVDTQGNADGSWADTELTTALWRSISSHDFPSLKSVLDQNPAAAQARSADGRGPLFWVR